MAYLEARGEKPIHWQLTANVAFNRTKQNYLFGAESHSLCDQVKSPQFTSSKLWGMKIKEPEKLREIRAWLLCNDWESQTNALYFSTVNGKMIYSEVWHGNSGRK
jgi:hypothetical protein